jgi:hypothetical protein
MKYGKLINVLLVCTIFLSCNDDESGIFEITNDPTGINLNNIEIGSTTTYLLYQSECDDHFSFTGDTLDVTIIQRNDSLFIHEEYTEGSNRSRSTEHVIIPKSGYVLIPERFNSEFLFFYGNDTIFLDRQPEVSLVQNGCQLLEKESPFIGDAIGMVEEFTFGDLYISKKKGISCVPGSFNIEAYIFYSSHLNAIHIINTGFAGNNIFGFMAIE